MSEIIDPKKIIDFIKDYYSILGITKQDLPTSKTRQNKIEIAKVIETAYRKMARKCHPDFGGSKEQFLDLVRARRILEDPVLRKIYDQGYFEETFSSLDNNDFSVDWDKIGTYRKGTPEDTLGFNIFIKLSNIKEKLGLIPAFFPSNEQHNYEWDWVISETNDKLALSLVNDENEVLRLTSKEFIDESLPFKIYLCIPQKHLNLVRKTNSKIELDGKTLTHGEISLANYNDINLIETTNLKSLLKYLDEKLLNDLESFRKGELLPNFDKASTKWMDTKNVIQFDKDKLNSILNMRSFEIVNDKDADKFLDNLKESQENNIEANKPELPL